MSSIQIRDVVLSQAGAIAPLLAAAALVAATTEAAQTVHADQPVPVEGVVHDQYGKPPPGSSFPSKYLDTAPHVTATRYQPPMSGRDDHLVEQAAIDGQGHYTLYLSPGVWELQVDNVRGTAQPQIPTVDTRDTPGPIRQDLSIAQIDATLAGVVTGDGLDTQHVPHVEVGFWSGTPHSSMSDYPSGWLTSTQYKLRVAPGTWLRGEAVQSNDGGYEERLDARVPFVVVSGTTSLDWKLPSFSFDTPACELPHTCSLTAHGSGWLPDALVDIYLVSQSEYPNGRPTGWIEGRGAVASPEAADRIVNQIITHIQPDVDGAFDGPVSGEAEITVASIGSQQTSTFAAVQRAPGVFKMAQPTNGFTLPPFDPFSVLDHPSPVVRTQSGEAPPDLEDSDAESPP